jgi:cellulose synthase/poly-beta-1,6-N-acetylglucosamine synthase-like glycosyltransferase
MSTDNLRFVSIIVPVYNGERTIENCIKSLLSLNYPASKHEIIIVDNNSKDNTLKLIRTYPVISLVEHKIQSSYATRNTGIRESRGEIVAFTDSDCIADKDWILKAVELFQKENIGCVGGRIEGYFPSNYIEEYLVNTGALSQGSTRFLPYAQTANAIYRRKVFDEIGLFEENWISGGDADLTWRMQLHSGYEFANCDDALIYHVHRSTLKGFFRQRMTWGYGEVSMYKKYKEHYKDREGELSKDYKEFLRYIIGKIPALLYNKLISKNEASYLDKKLTMIAMIGRRIGRIKGSVLQKEFYI